MKENEKALRMAEESEVVDTAVASMVVPSEAYGIIRDVMRERQRQNEKWGEQNHSMCGWIAVLTEEVGEAAKEACDFELGNAGVGQLGAQAESVGRFRTEMVQVAAVALQVLEAIDRGSGEGT